MQLNFAKLLIYLKEKEKKKPNNQTNQKTNEKREVLLPIIPFSHAKETGEFLFWKLQDRHMNKLFREQQQQS